MTQGNNVAFIQVSAVRTRSTATDKLPLKAKGWTGYFLLDMRGQFHNASLFDATLGLKRNLK